MSSRTSAYQPKFSIRVAPACRSHTTKVQFRRPEKHIFFKILESCTALTQSTGPENNGPERQPPGRLAPGPVFSLSRITLENKGKIRPQPSRENAFARASGGGNGTRLEPSPPFTTLTRLIFLLAINPEEPHRPSARPVDISTGLRKHFAINKPAAAKVDMSNGVLFDHVLVSLGQE